MHLGTPETIQNILNEDWKTILKNISFRQDLYQKLLHNNHRKFERELTLNEQQKEQAQGQNLHNLIRKIKEHQVQMNLQQNRILEKYLGTIISFESCIKLMGRIGAKILQFLKTTSERTRSLDECVASRYSHFKTAFIEVLTQKGKVNVEEAIKMVLEYSKQQLYSYLGKLEGIMKSGKKGEQALPIQIMPQKCSVKQKTKENLCSLRNKQISVNKSYRDSRKQQKSKKSKNKTKEHLYTIMFLSKHQHSEDIGTNPDNNLDKLLQELLCRNKLNSQHITNFIARYQEAQIQALNHQQTIQNVDMPEEKNMNSSLNFLKQPNKTQEGSQRDDYFDYVATEVAYKTIDDTAQLSKSHNQRLYATKAKLESPLVHRQDFPQLTTKTNNQQLCSIKPDFSKERRNQTIISRLPNIKRSSLYHTRGIFLPKTSNHFKEAVHNVEESDPKPKIRQNFFREQRIASQRAKIVLKSVQVGLDISSKKRQRFCKQEHQCFYERKKTDTTLESTIYMRKTINKFLDNKLGLFL